MRFSEQYVFSIMDSLVTPVHIHLAATPFDPQPVFTDMEGALNSSHVRGKKQVVPVKTGNNEFHSFISPISASIFSNRLSIFSNCLFVSSLKALISSRILMRTWSAIFTCFLSPIMECGMRISDFRGSHPRTGDQVARWITDSESNISGSYQSLKD